MFAFVDITFVPEDFVLLDFRIYVKLKDKSSCNSLKEILEFSYSILEKDTKVKTVAPANIEYNLTGQSGYIKDLSKEVSLKLLTHTYEKKFLYDLENMIKTTFVNELGKDF